MAKKDMTCSWGTCPMCKSLKLIVLGVLILLNAYMAWFSWAVFVGGIITLAGLLKLIWPTCPHCK